MGTEYHHDAVEQARLRAQADLLYAREMPRLKAALPTPTRVLDVGCGEGTYGVGLADALGAQAVQGIEANADSAAVARTRQRRVDVRDVLDDAPLPRADLVFARLVARHVSDAEGLVRKMVDAALPGGAVLLIDTDDTTLRIEPPAPAFEEARAATHARAQAGGADPFLGGRLRDLLSAAGLHGVDGFELTLTSDDLPPAQFAGLVRPYTEPANSGLTVGAGEEARAALLAEPRHFSWTLFYAWGRKPAAAASR